MKLKKNFWIVFGIDTIFFSILCLILYFIKIKIKTYLEVIEGFGPAMTGIVEQNAVSDALVNQINSLVNQTFLYIFLVIPVIFFLIYVIFQSASWLLTVHNKIQIKDYFSFLWKFALISLLPFAILFGIIYLYVTSDSNLVIILIVVLLALFYLVNIFYVASISSWKKIAIYSKSVSAFLVFILLAIFATLSASILSVMVYSVWKILPFLVINLFVIVFLKFSFVRLLEKKA